MQNDPRAWISVLLVVCETALLPAVAALNGRVAWIFPDRFAAPVENDLDQLVREDEAWIAAPTAWVVVRVDEA